MAWDAPPQESVADQVFDNLGQMGKPDWERACR